MQCRICGKITDHDFSWDTELCEECADNMMDAETANYLYGSRRDVDGMRNPEED